MEVLGHQIGKQGMRPSDLHLQGIRDLRPPQNGEDLMRFLGLANYLAGFVDHFVDVARPLYAVFRGTGFNKRKPPEKKLIILDWSSQWVDAQTKGLEAHQGRPEPPGLLDPPRRGSRRGY